MKHTHKSTNQKSNAIVILDDHETWGDILDTKIALLDPHFMMNGLDITDLFGEEITLADGSLPKDHIEEVICINCLLDFYLKNRDLVNH